MVTRKIKMTHVRMPLSLAKRMDRMKKHRNQPRHEIARQGLDCLENLSPRQRATLIRRRGAKK